MIKVAVIDTGLDLSDPRFKGRICDGSKDFTGKGIEDSHGHGTHIAGTIVERAGSKVNYCLLILRFYDQNATGTMNLKRMVEALRYAGEQRANLVNISGGGPVPEAEERAAIAAMPWALFIVSAGNDHIDAKEGRDPSSAKDENGSRGYYPAAYDLPNIVAVGALDKDGRHASYSNFGPLVKVWKPGHITSTLPRGRRGELHGTSQAAAYFTGEVLAGDAMSDLTPSIK